MRRWMLSLAALVAATTPAVVVAPPAHADNHDTKRDCWVASYTPMIVWDGRNNVVWGGGALMCGWGSRSSYLEVHHSEGFWHPVIATDARAGYGTEYYLGATGCNGKKNGKYFSEVGVYGTEVNSGDSEWIQPSC